MKTEFWNAVEIKPCAYFPSDMFTENNFEKKFSFSHNSAQQFLTSKYELMRIVYLYNLLTQESDWLRDLRR